MEELFSLFPIPFQANFPLPALGILVEFYPEKVENLEDLPLFTSILPLYDVIHTLHSHALERISLI